MAKIKTGKDFIREAISIRYAPSEWTPDELNAHIQERFDTGRQINNLRVTDITEKTILGSPENYDFIKTMNQLDRVIENEADPVKKAMAMAVRRVCFPEFNTIIEDKLLGSIKELKDEIINDPENSVSETAIKEFEARVAKAEESASRRQAAAPDTADYADMSHDEQLSLIRMLVGSFMDNSACRDMNGKVIRETHAMKQLIKRVNDCAKEIAEKIDGNKKADFKPADDREKADFDALRKQVKEMSAGSKSEFMNDVNKFNTLTHFSLIDTTPHYDSAVLRLDKSPFFTTTAESFVEKQKTKGLSNIELEWGESSIDYMVEALYTADELRDLKLAGIDPAMGILIDEKPFNWNLPEKKREIVSAQRKCEIVSQAMQGKKIDVAKYVPNGHGGYMPVTPVPVKTDLSMKTEKRSIWTILKQIFGFAVTIRDKVAKANKKARDYQAHPEKSYGTTAEQRSNESMRLREKDEIRKKTMDMMDMDFFGSLYPSDGTIEEKKNAISRGINKDSVYSDINNKPISIVRTLERTGSRVDLATLYGMSKGHTLEEMMADTPEGKNIRMQTGREFIEEIKVCELEKFAKDNELNENAKDTRDLYNKFILDKVQNVEMICAKSGEQLAQIPLPKPDPNNIEEFAKDYDKLSWIGSFAKDIEQGYKTLTVNKLAPTDEAVKNIYNRTSATHDYVGALNESAAKLYFPLIFYSDYVKSDEYVFSKNLMDNKIDAASKSKAFLTFFKEESEGINTINDLNNSKLCADTLAFSVICTGMTPGADKELYTREVVDYLPSKTPDHSSIVVDQKKKQVTVFGNVIDYSECYDEAVTLIGSLKSGIAKYDDILEENQRDLPLPERIEAIKAAQARAKANEMKADNKEKISLAELTGSKASVTAKPREAAPKEKALNIGGIGK